MPAPRLATLPLGILLTACGPQPAEPTATDTTGSTSASSSGGGSSSTGAPATGGPTTGELTTGDDASTSSDTGGTSGSTGSGPGTGTTTSTTGEPETTSTTDALPDEIWPCGSVHNCDENEHCTPEARGNADISGETPLGPFTGTFVFVSAAIAFGELGMVYVLPEYQTDVCEAAPLLLIQLGYNINGEEFDIEAPIVIDDGQGKIAQGTATVHVSQCCDTLWFCDCDNPAPYAIEISVVGEGWSLAGVGRPNCCRSYSIDEAA